MSEQRKLGFDRHKFNGAQEFQTTNLFSIWRLRFQILLMAIFSMMTLVSCFLQMVIPPEVQSNDSQIKGLNGIRTGDGIDDLPSAENRDSNDWFSGINIEVRK